MVEYKITILSGEKKGIFGSKEQDIELPELLKADIRVEATAQLNVEGHDGWELVSIVPQNTLGDPKKLVCFWKRQR